MARHADVLCDGWVGRFRPCAAHHAAADVLGLAYLHGDYVQPLIQDGRLARVLEDWCPHFPGYHLYYQSRQHLSAFALRSIRCATASEEADLVTFAIVLMTDDDIGSLKGGGLAPRARQNVILELGYFLSHPGQQRVCALITPGLETPSDFDGIVYIRMDAAGNWRRELLRELRAAGMPVVE